MFRRDDADRALVFSEVERLENLLGMNLPRIYAVEGRLTTFEKRLDFVENFMNRDVQRRRLLADSPAGSVKDEAPTVSVPPSVVEAPGLEDLDVFKQGLTPRLLPAAAPAQALDPGPTRGRPPSEGSDRGRDHPTVGLAEGAAFGTDPNHPSNTSIAGLNLLERGASNSHRGTPYKYCDP